MYKIYPSSSGFVIGNTGVISEYNSGCPRYLTITKNQIHKDIDPIYGKLGLAHEDRHAFDLQKKGLLEQREVPIKLEIIPGVTYSGRCDFLTTDGGIDETKASLSKNFLYTVIRKGKYKISHLAQLVSYLIQFKRVKGRIIAGYYDQALRLKEQRVFEVRIDDKGSILVDNEDSGYTVEDQWKHTLISAEALSSDKIKDRPINHVDFFSPCKFCALKSSCDRYDKGDITDVELLTEGLQLLKGDSK